jgi:tetratricopeptide (TPR) repeat protein
MNAERWARIVELLALAVEASPDERRALLEARCGDDASLVDEVLSLLSHEEAASGFLGTPALGDVFVAPATPEEASALPRPVSIPERLGGFHVRRAIASGGMGTVYEAEQERPQRLVALKVMRVGLASATARWRFEHEAQLLAGLRHPGIAQVYETGTWEDGGDGRPWFAMELVPEALSITDYARARGLGTRERLELFAQVCEAVNHGHQKGIVHRDLKPANILVDSAGRPKVIDFGVARATNADVAVTTLATVAGQIVGTIQYMSPEQCEGDPRDLDTRSDVYSLGIVLYELLCGRLPYEVDSAAILAAVRTVREAAPTRPSAVSPELRGDLEAILLHALEKDRERRYPSALELARDIRRFLADEPIAARPPSRMYELRLFARRNRVAVAAGALAALALVAASAVSGVFGMRSAAAAEREREQTERAREELETSEGVIEFLVGMFAEGDPANARGVDMTVIEALDRASERIERELAEEPLIRSRLMEAMGSVYRELGALEPAQELLEGALALREEALGREHHYNDDLFHELAVLYERMGRYEEAEERCRELIVRRTEHSGQDSMQTLSARSSLGVLFAQQGRLDEAEELWTEVLARQQEIFGEEDESALMTLHNLALLRQDRGQTERAERDLRYVVEVERRRLGDDHPTTMKSASNLARLLTQQGELEEASELYAWLLPGLDHVLNADHPQTMTARFNQALLLMDLERWEESEAELRSLTDAAPRALPPGHARIVDALNALGYLETVQGDYEGLVDVVARLLADRRAAVGDDHPETLGFMHDLALRLVQLDREEEAVPLLEELVELTPADDPAREQRVELLETARGDP